MNKKEALNQLKKLKNIAPDKEWARKARNDFVNYIDSNPLEEDAAQNVFTRSFEKTLAKQKWAGAFVFGLVVLMLGSFVWAQGSIPGSPLYPLKIASEEIRSAVTFSPAGDASLNASFAERRIDEASQLATTKLPEEDAEYVAKKLSSYTQKIEKAKTEGDTEEVEKAASEAEKQAEALTSYLSNKQVKKDMLREKARSNSQLCTSEKLQEEIQKLLDKKDRFSLYDAHFMAAQCDKAEESDSEEGNATSSEDDVSQSKTTTEDTATGTEENTEE